MKVIEMMRDFSKELSFVAEMLESDSKNYHAWQYRAWVLNQTDGWKGEFEFIENMLADDVMNNSVWNQRYVKIDKILPSIM